MRKFLILKSKLAFKKNGEIKYSDRESELISFLQKQLIKALLHLLKGFSVKDQVAVNVIEYHACTKHSCSDDCPNHMKSNIFWEVMKVIPEDIIVNHEFNLPIIVLQHQR